MDSDKKVMLPSPPRDKYNLVYIICCWLGIGMLLPWNFFYNVDGYWKYKFRDLDHANVTSEKQKFWASDLSIVSMAPNFLFLGINALIGHKLRWGYNWWYIDGMNALYFLPPIQLSLLSSLSIVNTNQLMMSAPDHPTLSLI